jgi:hypothetical protein
VPTWAAVARHASGREAGQGVHFRVQSDSADRPVSAGYRSFNIIMKPEYCGGSNGHNRPTPALPGGIANGENAAKVAFHIDETLIC